MVTPNSSAVRTITLADLLPVIWLIGAILFMTYYFAGYIVFRKSAMRFSEIVEAVSYTHLTLPTSDLV